jgi:hypothetical protein
MARKLTLALQFLRRLKESKVATRKKLLKGVKACELKLLSECCLNAAKGNVPLSRKVLHKHRKSIKKIIDRQTPYTVRKRVFVRQAGKGGFLIPLLTAAIPILTSLLRK